MPHVLQSRLVLERMLDYSMLRRGRVVLWRSAHAHILVVIVIATIFVGEVCRAFVFMRLRLPSISDRATAL